MSSIRQELQRTFQTAVKQLFGDDIEISPNTIQRASRPEFGDYQANFAMGLAKSLKKNPRELAQSVVDLLADNVHFTSLDVAGPGFINLSVTPDFLQEYLPTHDTHNKVPKRVVIDYGGANIAKEMHVGHLRSTVIGDAIARILTYLGDDVIRRNHLGDWGTQFGMLIEYIIQNDINLSKLQAISDLNHLYKQAKIEFDNDVVFKDAARKRVVALQSGDSVAMGYWHQLVDHSIEHFQKMYDQLGVLLNKDDNCGESFYNPMLMHIVQELLTKGIAVESEGANVVFLDGFVDRENQAVPLIVQKSNKGYLYATTDLAAIKYRVENHHAERLIYVTDHRQDQHFKMVFATAHQAGWIDESVSLEHVPFGTVLGKDKKPFKTRSGESITLSSLIEEAQTRAMKVVSEKNPDLREEDMKHIAHVVGISALKYSDLSHERIKDYVFDWDTMLSFEGNTAPYLLNAYVRIQSVFRKGKISPDTFNAEFQVNDPLEHQLLLQLVSFNDILHSVSKDLMIHRLCTYLFELAALYHKFYEHCRILDNPEQSTNESRLMLSKLTANTLKTGLNLLGIPVLERM